MSNTTTITTPTGSTYEVVETSANTFAVYQVSNRQTGGRRTWLGNFRTFGDAAQATR